MAAIMAANVISLDQHRRNRAKQRLEAASLRVPKRIEHRFSTEQLEAMVDAATRYQRQFDAYWAPAIGVNG